MPLLDETDPAPFQVIEGRTGSPWFITGDHAGRAIPRRLGTLGLSAAELDTHIAWDIGIAGVCRELAPRLGAFAILQTYSRLVIDCNRPLDAESSIATESEYTRIAGNEALSAEHAAARAQAIFHPYHERIQSELDRRAHAGEPSVYVAMHSFTPRFKGVERLWHCGVLYNRDPRFALRLRDVLRQAGLEVGDNQPYFVSDATDYGVPRHAERRGLLHVELEIRQDLIATPEQQTSWAERLATALPAALG